MSKRQFKKPNPMGASVDDRTIVAECRSVYGPITSKYEGEYYNVDWRMRGYDGHEMLGYSHVANNMKNFKQWQPFLDHAKRGSCWVVVVHDDLNKHKKDERTLNIDVLIDADHAPVNAEGLFN